jgi:hypothetical protein
MNEKLEAFRKRLRGPEKEKTNWPAWIGSPTAWLALFISSTTAFYSLLYHSDELSVVVRPGLIEFKDKEIGLYDPGDAIIINSGNRPIAVLGVNMTTIQASSSGEKIDCFHGSKEFFVLPFERIVVKPYDTVVASLKGKDGAPPNYLVSMTETNQQLIKANNSPNIIACLTFWIVAADEPWHKTFEVVGLQGRRHDGPRYVIKRNTFWTEVADDRELPYEGSVSIHPTSKSR